MHISAFVINVEAVSCFNFVHENNVCLANILFLLCNNNKVHYCTRSAQATYISILPEAKSRNIINTDCLGSNKWQKLVAAINPIIHTRQVRQKAETEIEIESFNLRKLGRQLVGKKTCSGSINTTSQSFIAPIHR